MYESVAASGDNVTSLVEAALDRRLQEVESSVVVRRPRSPWIVAALHGHHGRGLLGPARSAEGTRSASPVAEPEGPSTTQESDAAAPLGTQARLLDEGAGWLDTAVELERGLAQLAGARARALASFARCRPSDWDRQPGEQGAATSSSRASRPQALTEVSEWAVDEVAARLRMSGRAASELLAESVELVEQLPATAAALEAGDISWLQARALVQLLRPVSPDKKGLVEARVLPRAPRQTVAQLRECTKRAIARIDADAAVQRLARAIRDREVTLSSGEDGMAVLTAVLPAPVARACHEALRGLAEACAVGEDGRPDPRSLDQRMADCFADVFLRPDAEGRSPVSVLLTVVAGVGTLTGSGPDAEEPGEVDGDTVPAVLVRELAHTLGLLPRPSQVEDQAPAEDAVPVGNSTRAESSAPAEDAMLVGDAPRSGGPAVAPEAPALSALAALLDVRRLAGTGLAERPRIAVVDQLTGCLLALTDSIELRSAARSGDGLSPPEETAGYRPSAPLDRFVRLRDRRCRFPGCRARIRRCDLDHRVPYPHGPTAHTNLDGLCEHHHRLSHQAPGWRLGGSPTEGLIWTLPGGTTITTVPPAFGTDDGTAPAAQTARSERSGLWRDLYPAQRRARLRALVQPGESDERGADPPPF